MKSYFIRQDNKPQGPYSIDQLKELKLNPAALVYAEGLKQWIKALEIPELRKELFPVQPHTVAEHSETGIRTPEFVRQTKGFGIAKNLKTILAVIALIIATLLLIELKKSKNHSVAAKKGNQPAQNAISQPTASQPAKSTSEIRKDPRQKELENPAAYIKNEINWRKNLVGSIVLEGTLSNTATLVNFKDPVILVTWLSKSNESIGTTQYPVNKFLPAGQSISYKLKASAPSKIAGLRAAVVTATAVQ